jgi:nucleoside-diphosphate-sugar epimerase
MKTDILILGATGGIGYAVTRQLLAQNQPVTILVRSREKAQRLFAKAANLEIVEGDVQDEALLNQISADKQFIFHGINYPYDQWFGNIDTATRKVIEAASQNGATILYPGSVYNFGKTTEPIREDSQPNPCSRKGQLRVELEEMMAEAVQAGKCRVLVVRLPDFWGPNVVNHGIEPIFLGALKNEVLPFPANADVLHQFAFTFDAADIIVRLMGRKQQQPYEVYNYGGEFIGTGREFLAQVAQVAEVPLEVSILSRELVGQLAAVNPIMREVEEMLYLFEMPVILDNAKVRSRFPDFQPTPLPEAIAQTLAWFEAHRLPVATH